MKKAAEEALAVEASTIVKDGAGRVVNAAPEVPNVSVPADGPITFEMYCVQANIPPRHWPGRRAFTNLQLALFAEWDAAFKTY